MDWEVVQEQDIKAGDIIKIIYRDKCITYEVVEDTPKIEYKVEVILRKIKKLPAEIRSIVEHEDGWKYVRIGVDRWLGWDDLSNTTEEDILTDDYVSKESWTQIA